MVVTTILTSDERGHVLPSVDIESPSAQPSAVSWGAILAGAAAAAALSLILLMLGTGLGLSFVSPWAYNGINAMTFGVSAILWLTFTQVVAAGTGGYLAGRLRIKWIAVHTDEVYFRDTAHGFLAWAVASLVTATLLTSVIGSIVSGGVQAGVSVAGNMATTTAAAGSEMVKSDSNDAMGYFIDSLFRKEITVAADPTASAEGVIMLGNTPEPVTARSELEVTRIFLNTLRTESLPADDIRYVGKIVSQHTGLSQPAAEKRVIDTYTRAQAKLLDVEATAKAIADKSRKASAYAALWLFISLLIGAFVASFSATYGGQQRDQ
jgi:hypothetical protein